jgi:glutamate--cysteine ligase
LANPTYSALLSSLQEQNHLPLLAKIQRGIEKEGLRCEPNGKLSQKKHPEALGSALTHPSITTDYSEALLEFITPVFSTASEALNFLQNLHQFSYQNMGDESIWPASMPCILDGELSIPIAEYGSSNLGQLKHAYRHGLWHRYGRTMQAIAGIHYNFSMPEEIWPVLFEHEHQRQPEAEELKDFISARYFGLIRNFRRYSWLLFYLFGASPAVCKSFLEGREHQLQEFKEHSLYLPYATSLRMSDLGYQNNAQAELIVCYNKLDSYVQTLGEAVTKPVAAYEKIGLQDETGQFKQLNTSLLQIENEYYSDIRPKRIGKNGEKPLEALSKHGVEYIEVRCTDLNPFLTLGLNETQIHFMDLFLTHCLFMDSPEIDTSEYLAIKANQQAAVMQGRDPDLKLNCNGTELKLRDWADTLLNNMAKLAEQMNIAKGKDVYTSSLAQQRDKIADASLTPSAQYLARMKEEDKEFAVLTRELAAQHKEAMNQPLAEDVSLQLQNLATQSLAEQAEMEQAEEGKMPFADYLAAYLQR